MDASNDHYALLKYWRNALSDMDKIGPSANRLGQGVEVCSQQLEQGRLPCEKIEVFFKKAEAELSKRHKYSKNDSKNQTNSSYDNEQDEVQIDSLEVIIAPFYANRQHSHGTQKLNGNKDFPRQIFPLWIMAKLKRDGILLPNDSQTPPWIDRRYLTPRENKFNYPTLGDVDHVDEFYTQNSRTIYQGLESWSDIYRLAMELYEFVLDKQGLDALTDLGYSCLEKANILPFPDNQGMTQNIIKTYDQYIEGDQITSLPPLLKQFTEMSSPSISPLLQDLDVLFKSKWHLAQANNRFGLALSQRMSMGHIFESGDIVTIHGPPGTGKTTLLASFILSLWVQKAVDKQQPPVLTVASTNNLAVINVLDGFKGLLQGEDTLFKRWLPNLTTHGLYLCPRTKEQDAKRQGYLYCLQQKNSGNLAELYEVTYLEQAEQYFLACFNQTYQQNYTQLKYARDYIHQAILDRYNRLLTIIEQAYQCACWFYDFQSESETAHNKYQRLTNELPKIKSCLTKIKDIRRAWYQYKDTQLKWPLIFSWLPFLKQIAQGILATRIKRFCSDNDDTLRTDFTTVEAIENWLDTQHDQLQKNITDIEHSLEHYHYYTQQWCQIQETIGKNLSIEQVHSFSTYGDEFNTHLDTTFRHELFVLATHYWEASWLLNAHRQEKLKGKREYWQIQSMLTPCIVTTLHSGPSFFRVRKNGEFLTGRDLIDWLIVDEAGQVLPAIAGGMISVAKRALLVGDAKQIQPVSNLSQPIDLANAKKFGLWDSNDSLEQLKKYGVLCSVDSKTCESLGNLILLGQAQAKYQINPHCPPGLMLKEHWRCVPSIIQYCNELCYDNQLVIMQNDKPCFLPPMGYAHIQGEEQYSGSSRINSVEAHTIVEWIAKNQNRILDAFEADCLDQCVGIVTPFYPQGQEIKDHLHKYGLKMNSVGTVHALQGAEKDMIIFSPVYTCDSRVSTYFFDCSETMLNVTVSRAKRAFLVFGDMSIFDPSTGRSPSSLLARYLFASPDNELTDITQKQFKSQLQNESPDSVEQINTLARHRQILLQAFTMAKDRVCIVSPFISNNAISADNIVEKVEQYAKHITIEIYFNPYFMQRQHWESPVQRLEEAGSHIFRTRNVHSKLLIIDNCMIVQGSFNWLSASRNSSYTNEESSVAYQGKLVDKFIKQALNPIKSRVIND